MRKNMAAVVYVFVWRMFKWESAKGVSCRRQNVMQGTALSTQCQTMPTGAIMEQHLQRN
jgi:hypothetical protein